MTDSDRALCPFPPPTQVSVALIRNFGSTLMDMDMEEAIYLFKDIPSRLAADPKLADAILIAAHAVKWDASVQDGVDRYVASECAGEGGGGGVGAGGGAGRGRLVGGWEGEEGDENDASSNGSGGHKGGCAVS